jgi:hypothetical protein
MKDEKDPLEFLTAVMENRTTPRNCAVGQDVAPRGEL